MIKRHRSSSISLTESGFVRSSVTGDDDPFTSSPPVASSIDSAVPKQAPKTLYKAFFEDLLNSKHITAHPDSRGPRGRDDWSRDPTTSKPRTRTSITIENVPLVAYELRRVLQILCRPFQRNIIDRARVLEGSRAITSIHIIDTHFAPHSALWSAWPQSQIEQNRLR